MKSELDKFLPQYDDVEYHETIIKAPLHVIYECIRSLDFSESKGIRILLALRGMHGDAFTIDMLLKNGFILLSENPDHEIIIGLAGKFWMLSGCVVELNSDSYPMFNKPGFAKAVWNFNLTSIENNHTLLSTETRIKTYDCSSRRLFKVYWFFIKPFSSWIRKKILLLIKQHAERTYGLHA